MTSQLPRGIRNNNPLNLRKSNNEWLGKVEPSKDKAFEQFLTMEHGIRAAMKNIATIVNRRKGNGEDTRISDLIHIWAPNSDGNNEAAYLAVVLKKAKFCCDEKIELKQRHQITRLCWAMAIVECGERYAERLNIGYFQRAYDMAFGIGYNAAGGMSNESAR